MSHVAASVIEFSSIATSARDSSRRRQGLQQKKKRIGNLNEIADVDIVLIIAIKFCIVSWITSWFYDVFYFYKGVKTPNLANIIPDLLEML